MALDTLGHLLALHVTPANAEDRGKMERLARPVTDDAVEPTWVDQVHTSERAATAASKHGIALEVVLLPEQTRLCRFTATPGRRAVFRMGDPYRRLVKDYERDAETLAGLHVLAVACLMMKQAVALAAGS